MLPRATLTALLLLCGLLPAPTTRSNPPDRPNDSPAESQYVLLRNSDSVLAGTVTQLGNQIVVEQPGGKLHIDVQRVACWADSLAGLYQYQLEHRVGSSLSAHLRLAQWCIHHDYLPGAARELTAARRLAPDSPEVQQTLQRYFEVLQKQARESLAGQAAPQSQTTPEAAPDATPDASQTIRTAAEFARESGSPAPTPADLEPHLEAFTASIQPLLNNRCANCHGSQSKLAFHFESDQSGRRVTNREVTAKNMRAVAAWLDTEHPMASPLLVRALQPHGGAESPPLGPRSRAAIERLQQWVTAVAAQAAPQVALKADSGNQLATHRPSTTSRPRDARQRETPTRLPAITDPFDPDVFNRKNHPRRLHN